jgi:hypothetical protein
VAVRIGKAPLSPVWFRLERQKTQPQVQLVSAGIVPGIDAQEQAVESLTEGQYLHVADYVSPNTLTSQRLRDVQVHNLGQELASATCGERRQTTSGERSRTSARPGRGPLKDQQAKPNQDPCPLCHQVTHVAQDGITDAVTMDRRVLGIAHAR